MDVANLMSPSSSTHTHRVKVPPVPPDHALLMRPLFLTGSRSWCGAGLCYLNTVLLALSSMTRFHFYTPGMAAPHTHFLCQATCSGVCWAFFLLGRDSSSRCISLCDFILRDTWIRDWLHSLGLLIDAEFWSKSSS